MKFKSYLQAKTKTKTTTTNNNNKKTKTKKRKRKKKKINKTMVTSIVEMGSGQTLIFLREKCSGLIFEQEMPQ